MATKSKFRATDGVQTTVIDTAQATDIASASTTDIGAIAGNYAKITGTSTITSLGTYAAGAWRNVVFAGILTLTYNATSLILPTAANITTAAGDTAIFVSEGSGNWRCLVYFKANGAPLASVGGGDASTNTSSSVDSEIVLFSGTGGKTLKRATGTGTPYLTSGVLSINKVALTQPATGSTLTIADGKTATINNTLTFTGTDSSSVAFGAGGTVLYNGGALGTPTSGTLTNATGLPISTGVSGLGTNVATALAIAVGSAGAFVTFNGALGTPSAGTLTNATGLPVSTGITGLGTGVATALAIAVGSAGAFTTFNGALGTPTAISLGLAQGLISSATLTTSAITAGQVVLSVAAATYRDIFVRIQVVSGTSYQTFYLSVIHDGTSAWINNFGVNATFTQTGSNDLATFDADISAGNLRLLTTPANAVTVYRAYYEALNV